MDQRAQQPAPPTAAPDEPPPTLRLDSLVAPLLGMTFELRRGYEQQARLLTDLQHEIDVVRLSTTPFPRRRQGVDNLEHHFRELARASDDAEELLKSIRAAFDNIHQEAHDIEKRQRNL
ncbi:MAG TPA: hypothetical protein VM818_10430 [Vicinamibacterales bacterium]|nr:hypothetical protein [Vicinamibacterales bacterium]